MSEEEAVPEAAPDIFLSYASADRERAQRLARALGEIWKVFWDRDIPAGSTWREHLGGALAQARCVVVAWSKASLESRWVIEEAEDGVKRGMLIPVLLDVVDPPLGLRGIQARDLSGWSGDPNAPEFQALATDVGRLLDSPPPLPPEPVDRLRQVAAPALLTLNCALLLFAVKMARFFFVPLEEYLLYAVAGTLIPLLLLLFLPAARSAREALQGLFDSRDGRLSPSRASVSVALSVALLAVGFALRPRLTFEAFGQDIDSGESSESGFEDLEGSSISAENLCDPAMPHRGCYPQLPTPQGGQEGHYRLLAHLGWNRPARFGLLLEGAPPEVGFARVRVEDWLAGGQLVSEANRLGISSAPGTPGLSGTVELRLVCRSLEQNLDAEPTLRAVLTDVEEAGYDRPSVDKCWSLASGRAGAPCPSPSDAGG